MAYRKDRVTCTRGAALLTPYKVRATSVTNRVVASCCNSAMLLNFDDGKHWVDIYRERIRGAAPPAQMHLCTRFEASGLRRPTRRAPLSGLPLQICGEAVEARLAMSLAVFAEIRAALDLDQLQWHFAGLASRCVVRAGMIGRFILLEDRDLIADGHFRGAADDNPMLRPVDSAFAATASRRGRR